MGELEKGGNIKEVREGCTRIIFPEKRVFYNPRMEICRDIDIACLFSFHRRYSPAEYLDALAGTGIRGLRAAKEVGLDVEINDKSRDAYETIRENIKLNEVDAKAKALNEDANVVLSRRKYDIVDIDPFGSPAAFLDSSCRSVARRGKKGLLMITATDTAPLCGVHSSGMRKYDAFPIRTEYHREMGVRILLGVIIRNLRRHDKVGTPLISYAKEHFVRVILEVERGAKKADRIVEKMSYFRHCFRCGFREVIPVGHFLDCARKERCDNCGGKLRYGGPIFSGEIKNADFCRDVYNVIKDEEVGRNLGRRKEAMKVVGRCMDELDICFYYELHSLCKRLHRSPIKLSSVLDALHQNGFLATRTVFSDTAFKTNAGIREIEEIFSSF